MQSIADKITHCELCKLPLWLYDGRVGSICADCSVKAHIRPTPCDQCGRWHTYQHHCQYCSEAVCDGCVDEEHEGRCDRRYENDYDFSGSDY